VLDTCVLSDFLEGREPAAGRVRAYLAQQGILTFSAVTWYEIERGLRAIGAARRQRAFDRFTRESTVLPLDLAALDRAADVWCALRRAGRPVNDADILIAATALANGCGVATRDHHFDEIPGLRVERWGAPAQPETAP